MSRHVRKRSLADRLDPGPWVVIPILLTVVIIALPYALGWR